MQLEASSLGGEELNLKTAAKGYFIREGRASLLCQSIMKAIGGWGGLFCANLPLAPSEITTQGGRLESAAD